MFEDGKRWTSEKYEAPPNLGARQLCTVVMQRFQEREHAELRLSEAVNEWDAVAAWSADGPAAPHHGYAPNSVSATVQPCNSCNVRAGYVPTLS